MMISNLSMMRKLFALDTLLMLTLTGLEIILVFHALLNELRISQFVCHSLTAIRPISACIATVQADEKDDSPDAMFDRASTKMDGLMMKMMTI